MRAQQQQQGRQSRWKLPSVFPPVFFFSLAISPLVVLSHPKRTQRERILEIAKALRKQKLIVRLVGMRFGQDVEMVAENVWRRDE